MPLGEARANEKALDAAVFARVGDTLVSQSAFDEALNRAIRQRYYHGQPPRDAHEDFARSVARDVVERTMLLQEATRRGLTPATGEVEARLEQLTRRYAKREGWLEKQKSQIEALRQKLTEDNLLAQLEERARRVAEPTDEEVHGYYEEHPPLFTEPTRDRVSVILLQVAPSSPAPVWKAARTEALQLVSSVRNRADFAELARLRSGDASAADGGDMGYLHQGMLSEVAEKAIAQLSVGEVSDPVTVLEGIAVFRLEDRQPARLNSFDQVKARARELCKRQRADDSWNALLHRLRTMTPVQYRDESFASSG